MGRKDEGKVEGKEYSGCTERGMVNGIRCGGSTNADAITSRLLEAAGSTIHA